MSSALVVKLIEREVIKTAYLNALATLEQIQTATNPTNAQVIQAIKDIAHLHKQTWKRCSMQYRTWHEINGQ